MFTKENLSVRKNPWEVQLDPQQNPVGKKLQIPSLVRGDSGDSCCYELRGSSSCSRHPRTHNVHGDGFRRVSCSSATGAHRPNEGGRPTIPLGCGGDVTNLTPLIS